MAQLRYALHHRGAQRSQGEILWFIDSDVFGIQLTRTLEQSEGLFIHQKYGLTLSSAEFESIFKGNINTAGN